MITINSINRTHVVTDNGKIPIALFKKNHKELEPGKSYQFTVLNDEILDFSEIQATTEAV